MSRNKTIILIDGHSLAYRSYFALERTGMRNSNNEPTWAVFGFFKAFFDLISRIKPDAMAISFDVSKHTFRNDKYSEYKANRPPMPDDMREQVKTIRKGIETLNIPIYEQEGYEADDVIGTLCKKISSEGNKVIILTGDQDSFQLLDDDNVRVLLPSKGELIEYNRDRVFEKLGVYPEQIPDYKGLCGDPSDNIPGVKGIGKKGAADLLNQFKSLEDIYINLDKVSKKRIKSLLEEYKDMAIMSKDLARIRRDIELNYDFKCCNLEIPNLDEFIEFLKYMEFRTFLNQLPKLFKDFENFGDFNFSITGTNVTVTKNGTEEEFNDIDKTIKQDNDSVSIATAVEEKFTVDEITGQAKLAFVTPIYSVNPIDKNMVLSSILEVENLVKTLKTRPVFSIDLETNSLNVLEAKIVGIAIAWQEDISVSVKNNKLKVIKDSFNCHAAYIPVGHTGDDNIEIDSVLSLLKPVLEDSSIPKILQNAKYDIHVLLNYNVKLNNVIFDTMLASYIDDPSEKHGLKDMAFKKFKIQMTEYEDLCGTGKNQITMDKLEVEKVSGYANMDAAVTFQLAHYFANKFDEEQSKLLYEMELPLINVLVDMERAGIALDIEYLNEMRSELTKLLSNLEDKIYKEANYHQQFNINSPKQLGEILFEHMGIPAKGKTKTKSGYSTSAKVLESLAKKYRIAELILEYRHLSKLKSTYVDALPKLINNKTNRVHTTFNQTVTTTGRLSSSDPNLQNIPIRTEIGNRIRKAFVPGDREKSFLMAADYSQIELRFLADISQEPNLIEAFKQNKDIHADTACKVFGISHDKVTKEMRRQAKAVNFGLVYGQTAYGLSETIGITPKEAKEFIDKYFKTYPKVKEYMETRIVKSHQTGYVITKFGRKRFLMNDLSSKNKTIREFAERAAINSPLQGSAADLIKMAMISLWNQLNSGNYKTKLLLQVHDELVLEVPENEIEEMTVLVKNCMENASILSIPLVADVCIGNNWMEAK
ncbi:MAG: DNA polymerase I [Cyanobacteriota bacterium]